MMKNKIVSAGLAGLFCAVTLAGCGGAASSEAASSEAASSVAASSEAASSVAASSVAASSAAASSEAVSSEAASSEAAPTATPAGGMMPGNVLYLTGTVTNASMNTFTLTLEDGSTTEIMISDDCDKELESGLAEGLSVSVAGTTEDGGASMTAMYITDGSDALDGMLYGSAEFLTGTVADAMMSGFTLKLDDGTDVQVTQQDDTQMNLANGMSDGLRVGVAGVLGEQGEFLAVCVTDDEYAVSEYAHELSVYVGTLQNCMMNSFSLVTEDGATLDFLKSDACLVQMEGGLADGARVIIKGYEADGTLTALAVMGAE